MIFSPARPPPRRRKDRVAGLDLVGVDDGLAVEAHVARLRAFARKALRVAEVVVDAVEDVEAIGARRRDAGHQPQPHRLPARQDFRARLLGEIVGAHDEACEPRLHVLGGGRDLARIEHGERRLHHRPDADLVIGADVDEALGHVFEMAGAGHFRHQDRVGLRLGGGVDVVEPPLGVEPVDADDDLARAEPAGRHRRHHLRPRRFLAVGRDRIFEVEDDRVGRQRARLLDRAGVRARHVEHAAARSDGHWQAPCIIRSGRANSAPADHAL